MELFHTECVDIHFNKNNFRVIDTIIFLKTWPVDARNLYA